MNDDKGRGRSGNKKCPKTIARAIRAKAERGHDSNACSLSCVQPSMGHARGHARAEARRCWRVAFFLSIAGKKISLARPRACSLALLTTTTTTTTRSLVYAEDRKNNAQGLQWKKSRGSSGPQAPSKALGRGSPSRRPITTSVHGLREQEGVHQEAPSGSNVFKEAFLAEGGRRPPSSYQECGAGQGLVHWQGLI